MYYESKYDKYQYKVVLPAGVTESEVIPAGFTSLTEVDLKDALKSHAVIKLNNGVYVDFISSHARIDLADKKASQLSRAEKDLDIEYIAVPLKLCQRLVTVFTKDGWFGNADDTFSVDTSKWTIPMWDHLRWNWNRLEYAKHYAAGIHSFDAKSGICVECYLTKANLGLV